MTDVTPPPSDQADLSRASDAAAPKGVDPRLAAVVPRKPLTDAQRAAALARLGEQATERIRLGKELLTAADTRLSQQKEALDAIRAEHQVMRDLIVASTSSVESQLQSELRETIAKIESRLSGLETRITQIESLMADR